MLFSLATLLAAAGNPNQSPVTNPVPVSGDPHPFGWSTCLVSGDVATLNCFSVIFQRFVIGAFMLSGITAAIFIAYSGVRMILAQGDAKKLEGAQHTLTYAIIGLVVVFLAAFIVSVIAYITGVRCISDVLPGFTNCASSTP
jgi:hypothetical protein